MLGMTATRGRLRPSTPTSYWRSRPAHCARPTCWQYIHLAASHAPPTRRIDNPTSRRSTLHVARRHQTKARVRCSAHAFRRASEASTSTITMRVSRVVATTSGRGAATAVMAILAGTERRALIPGRRAALPHEATSSSRHPRRDRAPLRRSMRARRLAGCCGNAYLSPR